eukprot:g4294.t1
MAKLLGMGNPLLDISAVVPQEELAKWGAKEGDAILAEEKHAPMYAELVKNYDVEYVAGGATQNSIRICAGLLGGKAGTAAFFGCIGKDDFGNQLKNATAAAGVQAIYQVNTETQTGTCAVLVKDKERSLVANLAAANKFTESHLDTEEAKKAIEAAEVFYCSGFFLTVSPPSLMRLAKHACEKKKVFMLNLAAPFLCQFFKDPMLEAIPLCDVVFGNETEAAAFAEHNGLDGKDACTVAQYISAMPLAEGKKERIAIITQGAEFTAVSVGGKAAKKYPVKPIEKSQIVDSNGAGDAFVGGFLARYLQKKSLDDCVESGHTTAGLVIRETGPTLPESAIGMCA